MDNCSECPNLIRNSSEQLAAGQVVICTGCGTRSMWNADLEALTHIDEIPEDEFLGG